MLSSRKSVGFISIFQIPNVKSISFLKGIGIIKRKLANTSYPTLEITKEDDDYINMVRVEIEI